MVIERGKIIPAIRKDSYNVWMSIDPICHEGDIMYASNTPHHILKTLLKNKGINTSVDLDQIHLIKIADGIHKYSELDFAYVCLPVK